MTGAGAGDRAGGGLRRLDLRALALEVDEEDPEAFRSRYAKLGPGLGARRTGATLYELAPGVALCPYHFEYAEEEWLLVLEGEATVRHPGGTEVLGPMELAFFPLGPDGAHQVRNDGEETVRVLMLSEVAHPAFTAYPDSDKVGVYTGVPGEDLIVRRGAAVDYYDGEEVGDDR